MRSRFPWPAFGLSLVFCLGATPVAPIAHAQPVAVPAQMQIDGIPGIPPSLAIRMNQYLNTRSCSFDGWLADGSGVLVSTRFGETLQFHLVDTPGGARRQITFFSEPIGGGAVSPSAARDGFVFTRDEGGSENYQVYHFDLKRRAWRRLTSGEGRSGVMSWSHKGDKLAFMSNERNGVDFDVRVMDPIKDTTSRILVQDTGFWLPGHWSPDDKKLLVLNYVSVTHSDYWIVDTKTGGREPLQTLDEPAAYGGAVFDKSGRGVYFVSDQWDGTRRLAYLPQVGDEPDVLTQDLGWDVEELDISPNAEMLAYAVNESGTSKLYVQDTKGGRRRSVALPLGELGDLKFSPDGRRLGFTLETPQSPADVYALELDDQGNDQLVRWTQSEVGGLDNAKFVEPTLIHFRAHDTGFSGGSREIPAFYFEPDGPGPHPVVIYIHGGPEGQTRPDFRSQWQYWIREQGIAVLAPNVRGSTGYGRDYAMLDNGLQREDSVKDIGSLLDWIDRQPELDAERVGLYGGSYGGYMVLASLVHYGDRVRAAVEAVGISNFVTFLENTQEYRRDLRRVEYGDERDPEMRAFLESISPLTHAQQITTPLCVAQGANDPRVPASEAEQIVAAVRKSDTEVWYMLAGDEGHGFRKKRNRDYYRYVVALFWERYLIDGREG